MFLSSVEEVTSLHRPSVVLWHSEVCEGGCLDLFLIPSWSCSPVLLILSVNIPSSSCTPSCTWQCLSISSILCCCFHPRLTFIVGLLCITELGSNHSETTHHNPPQAPSYCLCVITTYTVYTSEMLYHLPANKLGFNTAAICLRLQSTD